MMPSPVAPPRSELRGAFVVSFVRTSVACAALLLLVRVYEQFIAGGAHRLSPSTIDVWARALASDVACAAWVMIVLAVPMLLLGLAAPRLSQVVHRAAVVVVILGAVALTQYFAVTGVPLGADLFGYSWRDIRETVSTSGGVSVASLIGLAIFAVLAVVLPSGMRRLRWSPRAARFAGVALAAFAAVPSLLTPPPTAFASDGAYMAAVSKPGWFASRSVRFVIGRWRDAQDANALSGYPLMHAVQYDDVLGPQLALRAEKPNIVFVIVEGLGRDFTGPGAAYGGFTPFLDSLTEKSLSWDHFLSTSGRTFGVLPSLLGSLPFGPSGLMELGDQMPAHASLVTLLHGAGYAANYFTGTNGAFDRIDAFMERQGVDRFVDAAGFGPAYEKMPSGPDGQSWGYPDAALFNRSLELLAPSATPRVDVYLTISTHEPFIPPRESEYRERFERRLAELPLMAGKRAAFRESQPVFESLLYTDDALRGFLGAYAKRPDYPRTIFVITGDHRLIPVPPTNRLSRYHVPLVVFSPMLRAPHHVAAVSSHFDVLPSLLAMLKTKYAMAVPDSAPWLGTGLDTARTYRHTRALPLMRTKNELDEFLTADGYLAQGQFYHVDSTFELSRSADRAGATVAADALRRFRAVNTYSTTRDRVTPLTARGVVPIPDQRAVAAEDSAYRAAGLSGLVPERAFAVAEEHAVRRDFPTARLILRRLLRQAPSYHDARVLLGRTYAWEQRFDTARTILDDLVRRAPSYPDGLAARIEVDIFTGKGDLALAAVDQALSAFPRDPTLLFDKARALELLGRKAQALGTLDALQRVAPTHPDAPALRRRLTGS